MTTRKLTLSYTAYIEVELPADVADRMESGDIHFWDKWGVVYWRDNGRNFEVEGTVVDVDYKRSEGHEFADDGEECENISLKAECASVIPVGNGPHWAIPAAPAAPTTESVSESEYDFTELGAIPKLIVSDIDRPTQKIQKVD